mmetsp:Transcript_36936/g.95757  ORF Transcript_36936/g.95757 Transcript_36936/m.95757 type:complete len:112 (+) Transcript_36936:742-1077(+)
MPSPAPRAPDDFPLTPAELIKALGGIDLKNSVEKVLTAKVARARKGTALLFNVCFKNHVENGRFLCFVTYASPTSPLISAERPSNIAKNDINPMETEDANVLHDNKSQELR